MARRRQSAFAIMELIVSLALAGIAFGSFLSVFQSVQQQQRRAEHRTGATLLLQSVLEQARAGWLAGAADPARWEADGAERVVFPATPTAYRLDEADTRYTWQLVAGSPPRRGELFTFEARVFWKEAGQHLHVSAVTQVGLK